MQYDKTFVRCCFLLLCTSCSFDILRDLTWHMCHFPVLLPHCTVPLHNSVLLAEYFLSYPRFFAGLNREIYYSIVSGDPYRHFQIDTHSGKIYTNTSLDREDISQYNLTIMGRNKYAGNGFEHISTVSLRISLLDENDYEPYFTTDLIV